MQEPYQQQDAHATIEEADASSRQGDGESDAEEYGEDGIELTVNEQVLQESRHVVGIGGRHGFLCFAGKKSPKSELREIGQCNTQQSQSPQGIQHDVSLFLSCRSVHDWSQSNDGAKVEKINENTT